MAYLQKYSSNPNAYQGTYGYSGQAEVQCACGRTKDTIELGDEVQASSMDELT